MDRVYDLAVIGGGINGCGITRDAAGRGASVYLCEMNDLASATSSWSTKLVHGGLRYLEYYEFRLVREALQEREVLWRIAPHIIAPLRFVLPYHKGLRPAWMLRLGLFLYDHLGGRELLPGTKVLDLTRHETGAPLKSGLFAKGFEYSDCRVDDSRLTVLNAMAARQHGARIATRTRLVAARREAGEWVLTVENQVDGTRNIIRARAVVNAAGPWVANVLRDAVHLETKAHVRLVQGSHIVVPKLFDHDRAYIFQNGDGRIVFAIPYQQDFTLIGTTDRDYAGDPAKVHATDEEIAYLCEAANGYFARSITPQDVVWAYSGVRPLYDDGASEAKAATRDYVLELDTVDGSLPLLSVFGGKITTYRRLAEAALERLTPFIPALANRVGWTGVEALPGGNFGVDRMHAVVDGLMKRFPFVPLATMERLAHTHGVEVCRMFDGCVTGEDLGRDFGAGLSEREVHYLMSNEWARTAEDVAWRRTKLGLRLTKEQMVALNDYMAAQRVA